AFALMAQELNQLATPDEAIFYTSGRASNEAAFLYQLFARAYGTNNLPDCSNMCHESSGAALGSSIGIGKGTVKLDDFEKAELILILGQNPGTNHPRMLTALQKAKRAGACIIAINPLREAGLLGFQNPQEIGGMLGRSTPLADDYLPVRIGGDQALLQGILKWLIEHKQLATSFITTRTDGFAELEEHLAGVRWETILEQTALPREAIERVAAKVGRAERIIACWAMGLTQQKHAVPTIQELVNLLLARGSIGKPGAGVCPVRGHSNVQGDRTMGIYEKPSEVFLRNLEEEFHFTAPRKHGFDTVAAIRAMRDGVGKVFIALGGNFLSATPDTTATAAALRQTRLTAHVAIKLNRSHLVTGRIGLILPCLGRTEIDRQGGVPQFITTENSMGIVQRSEGNLEPASPELLSEPVIVARLAAATLGPRSTVPWMDLVQHYDRIRDRIAACIVGFTGYNDRVRRPGGFYLPNAPRDGTFPTTTGRARFTTAPLPDLTVPPGQLIMMTIRTHDQFNTTIYGLDDRYRGIQGGRQVILMNKIDIADRNLHPGDRVRIQSHFQNQTREVCQFLIVPYDIPRGCCATYFPETNVLVPLESVADTSHTPTSKWVLVSVHSEGQA
ncbi:MAG: FdhF/YdeP family oxidoreductase, partial [Gemmataceae bacterium]